MKIVVRIVYLLIPFIKSSFADTEGAVRLVTDTINAYEGIVEVYHSNRWVSIDQRDINDKTASVICRLLGLGDKGFEIDYYYTRKRTQRLFSYLYCDGDEANILDCSYSLRSLYNSTYGAGVICKGFNSSSLRLHGGSDASEGRLEFLYDGQWTGVCEDTVDYEFYHLACKRMGYGVVESYQEDLSVHTENVDELPFQYNCHESDSNLDSCQTRVYSYNNCTKRGGIVIKCKPFFVTSSRITGGIDISNGRVELFDGSWKTVCSLGFLTTAADTVCRNNGWKTALSISKNTGDSNKEIIPYYISCDNYETNISECRTINLNYSCSHDNDVYIKCSGFQIRDVRLVNGQDNSEGRIEFDLEGTWMTFCDKTYRADNLDVICKMKGYRTARKVYKDAYFGEGNGGIITNWIYCSSNDVNINDCTVRSSGYSCTHSDDLSVACSDFAITDARLVNGTGPNEGRLELRIDDEWMTVCDGTFLSGFALDSVCKSFGFRGVLEIIRDAYYGQGSGDIVTHYFSCPTDAESLTDCNVRYSGNSGCSSHSDDLSVVCSDLEIQDIRLADGGYSNVGRVEMLVDDEWRTVCGSYWTTNDMDVLCKNLGFLERDNHYYNAYFGEGNGKIMTTDFVCNGREHALHNCTVKNNGNTCTHSNDLSIKCIACSSLAIPTNGHITISGTSHGDFARFDCKPGYGLVGSSLRVCQSNNTWNGTLAECVTDCGDMSAPANGSVIYTSTLYQAISSYECDPGFDLVNMTNRTCMNTGTWSGSIPTCNIKDCGPIEAPQNGTVDISSGTKFTTVAQFQCDPGFTLYGDKSRRCQEDGTWSRINTLCLESDTNGSGEREENKIAEGLLYGGISAAVVFGVLIGVIVTVLVLRKRRRFVSGQGISHANRAYEDHNDHVNSSDTYDSLRVYDSPMHYQNLRPPPRVPNVN